MATEKNSEKFLARLEGPGIKVNKEVNQGAALAILHIILGGEIGQVVTSQNIQSSKDSNLSLETAKKRPLSVGEYINEAQARSNPEKIVAIGEFFHALKGKKSFSRDQIISQFREAREQIPANFPRDFTIAIKNNWIAQDPEGNGQFYVTNFGKIVVENKFKKEKK